MKLFSLFNKREKRTYLDYAASTPVSFVVEKEIERVRPFFQNPSSLHQEGVHAKDVLHTSRVGVAKFLGAHVDEIIFTASGTESCVLAIRGVLEHAKKDFERPHVIISSIEHVAVLETVQSIEGIDVTRISVDETGSISLKELKEQIREETVLVSIMMVNNEIGTIAPIREVGLLIRKFKKERGGGYPLFHTDASQAALYEDIQVEKLHTDLLTLDGIKCYGPRGIGILYKKRGVTLEPLITGGGHEKGLRSGTENIEAISGLNVALKEVETKREQERIRIEDIRTYTKEQVSRVCPQASFNESVESHAPHILSICFPKSDSEFVVLSLDALGIACAHGSACQSLHGDTSSHVLKELHKEGCDSSSVRISFGLGTTKKDIDKFTDALRELVHRGVIISN